MQTRLTTILPREPFVVEEIETIKSEPEDESSDPSTLSNSKTVISEDDVKVTDSLFDKMEKINDANAKKSLIRSKKKKLPEADASEEASENSQKPKRIKWKKSA